MDDAQTPVVEDTAPVSGPDTGAPSEGKADRAIAEMRRERDTLKKELAQFKAQEAERERAEAEKRGEWEKLAKEAEARAEAAEKAAVRTRAEALIQAAAAKAGFRDASDAITHLGGALDTIDGAEKAEKLVAKLAKDRDYLLAPKQPEPAGLAKVLENGLPVDPDAAAPDAPAFSRDELARITPQQVSEMSDAQYAHYLKSVAASGGSL
jgi:hypothetical protein